MTPFEWGFWAAFGAMAAVGSVICFIMVLLAFADLLVWAFEGVEKRLWKPKRK